MSTVARPTIPVAARVRKAGPTLLLFALILLGTGLLSLGNTTGLLSSRRDLLTPARSLLRQTTGLGRSALTMAGSSVTGFEAVAMFEVTEAHAKPYIEALQTLLSVDKVHMLVLSVPPGDLAWGEALPLACLGLGFFVLFLALSGSRGRRFRPRKAFAPQPPGTPAAQLATTMLEIYLRSLLPAETAPAANPITPADRSRALRFGCWLLALALVSTALTLAGRSALEGSLDHGRGFALKRDLGQLLDGRNLVVVTAELGEHNATVVGVAGVAPEQVEALQVILRPRLVSHGLDPTHLYVLPLKNRPPEEVFDLFEAALAAAIGAILLSYRKPTAPAVASVKPKVEAIETDNGAVEAITVEVGRSLLSLVTPATGAPLLERVKSIRLYARKELGFIVPGIRFWDNPSLKVGEYRILIRGRMVGSGELVMNHLLAIGPLSELEHLPGKLVKDPTYNMEGKWIPASEKVKSQTFGCMVFDCVSVVATQLTEMVRIHAGELYTLEAAACHLKDPDVQYVAKTLVPARLELVQVWQILRNLMEERIAIRDRLTILQSLLEFTAETRDVDELTERVRGAILGDVLHAIDPDEPPVIQAWFLPPEHEQMLRQGRAGGVSAVGLGIVAAAHAMKEAGLTPVVVVAADLRRQLVKMLDTIWPTTSPATRRIWVLSRTETVFRGQKVTRFLSKTTSTG